MTTSTDTVSIDESARLFLRFLDLSRDVDRNRQDSALAAKNTEIIYVMDAGIAETFLDARDPRGWSASLHTKDWSADGSAPEIWRNYAAQTALVTADYLFSGTLPGQHGSKIWMTKWHRKELVRRLEQTEMDNRSRFREFARDQSSYDRVMQRFETSRNLVEEFKAAREPLEGQFADTLLTADLQHHLRTATRSATESTLFNRLALNVLVNDRYIEPAEQLKRLVTPPLSHQLTMIENRIGVTHEERDGLARAARYWFQRLEEECKRRGVKIESSDEQKREPRRSEEGSRSAAALWDDARSLALVLWAALRTSEDTIIVFVTADNILFDTYRRWYTDLTLDDPDYAQPFRLRRLRQYAPSFNLLDSGLAQGGYYRKVFKEIEEILELMLLPLRLARAESKVDSRIVDRMRESSALRGVNPDPFTSEDGHYSLIRAIEKEGARAFMERLVGLTDRWRELERAALGQADAEVERRTRNDKEWFQKLSPDPEARAEGFMRYIESVMSKIALGSRQVSLQFAQDVIDGWRPPPKGQMPRAPLALRLEVTLKGESVDVGSALMAKLYAEAPDDAHASHQLIRADQWPELYDQPPHMFAIASAMSLAQGDWADGMHFADRALRAVGGVKEDSEEIQIEIQYLAAMAKRFYLGTIGPATTISAENRIFDLHRDALELNNRCIMMQAHEAGQKSLRSLRSISERAALRLFYVTALNPLVVELAKPRKAEPQVLRGLRPVAAEYEIKLAEDDLRDCFAIDRIDVQLHDVTELRFKRRLRRQIYINAASSHLLRRLWGFEVSKESVFSSENPSALRRIEDSGLRNLGSSVMAADVLAFRAFAGDTNARRELRKLGLSRDLVPRLDYYLALALKNLVMSSVPP